MNNLLEICERCDKLKSSWTIREARIEVGQISRKPHLCEDCTAIIQDAIRAALAPKKNHD